MFCAETCHGTRSIFENTTERMRFGRLTRVTQFMVDLSGSGTLLWQLALSFAVNREQHLDVGSSGVLFFKRCTRIFSQGLHLLQVARAPFHLLAESGDIASWKMEPGFTMVNHGCCSADV